MSSNEIIEFDDPEQGPTARAKALWANKKIRTATIQSLAELSRARAAVNESQLY